MPANPPAPEQQHPPRQPAPDKAAMASPAPGPWRSRPQAAAGEVGLLVRPRTAPLSVVPAPPDRSGDELRHPANSRAASALDLRRPPWPLTPRQTQGGELMLAHM